MRGGERLSRFSWLDHSEQQRRRMLEVVSLFHEQGTVDELGIGPIRDAISDALFPGLSVLHTRARYLLFVPWLARRLETGRVHASDAPRRFRQHEVQLIHALIAGDAGLGVIGVDAQDTVKRLPSVLYWGALRRFGILRHPGTAAQYLRSLGSFAQAARRAARDDEGEVTEGAYRSWHPDLPAEPDRLLDETTFTLTSVEADFLEDRVLASVPGSLLAHLLATRTVADVADPWQHPALASASPDLRRTVDHAHRFSTLLHGANLLYNLLLSEQVEALQDRGVDDRVDEYRWRLEDWAIEVRDREGFYLEWNLDDFWALVLDHNPRLHPTSRDFVRRWVALTTDRIDHLADDETARLLVRDRELRVKGALARLRHTRQLERWSGASGLGRLDYRWNGAAKRIVEDLVAARAPAAETS
jgi:hypothetical protein